MKKLLFVPVAIFFIVASFLISNTRAAVAPTFVSKWGSGGDVAGELNSPRAITVDSDGNVYVADAGDLSIKKFDKDGVFLTKWGSYRYTYAPGTFGGLCGLEADSFNNIYVADCSDARQHVQKFSSNGEFLAVIGGTRGTGEGQFFGGGQNDVAVDSKDNVYVLDAAGQTGYYGVHVFSSNGTFIKRWGPFGSAPLRETYQDNELRSPFGIAIDSQDSVYITDGNREVKKFTKDGVFITKWGIDANGWNLFSNPSGIDVDDDNNAYVVDYSSNDIQVFNSNGVFLFKWGSLGSGDGQFNIPYDTAVYGDYVYVVDAVNHRIQKFARTSSCTEDTFSCGSWGECSVSGSQVRICKKTYDCSIGNSTSPATSQSCTYIPPTCTSWVYSSWSACSESGQQTRTVLSSSPSGCTGGSPVTTQSCTYTPPVPPTPAPTSNNLALNKPATASNVYRGYGVDVTIPSKANDGDITAYSYWNAGAYPPQWWEVDLLGSYTVERIELVVGQDPSNIITTHEVWVTYGNGTTSNVHTFSGLTSDYGVLSFVFNPALSGVTKVKIKTTSSQSWVAWREVRLFGSSVTSSVCTASDWSCDGWGACSANSTKTRVCNKNTNCEGGVPPPTTSQSCVYTPPVPACTDSDWSCVDWGICSPNNTQKRNCSKISNCQGGIQSPETTQSCTYTPPTCTSWRYSTWSTCSIDGQQERSVKSALPANCTDGNPRINQSCVPMCREDKWRCGNWGPCFPDGQQTRVCVRDYDCPLIEGEKPETEKSCVYTPPTCATWRYSAWSACSLDGQQSRTVISASPAGCDGGNPKLSQTCTPPCLEDKWQCDDWSSCSPQGVQGRSCRKVFDCASVETAVPATSQYCQSSYQQPAPLPDDDIDQDFIIRSTVKLACYLKDGRTLSGVGSGTIIDPNGIILTNNHVVKGTIGCLVGFQDSLDDTEPDYREIADISKISTDPNLDIALLKIRKKNNDSRFSWINITKGNNYKFKNKERLYIYGYPVYLKEEEMKGISSKDLENILLYSNMSPTDGIYSGNYANIFIKTSAKIERGNSGGGAYTQSGTFIGIPTAAMSGDLESLGLILTSQKINQWLNNSKIAVSNLGATISPVLAKVDMKNTRIVYLNVSDAKVLIYSDKTKKQLLPNRPEVVRMLVQPTFQITSINNKGIVGYYVYFGSNLSTDPVKSGRFATKNEFVPNKITKDGTYYFIFKAKNKDGVISDSFITEYVYKAPKVIKKK